MEFVNAPLIFAKLEAVPAKAIPAFQTGFKARHFASGQPESRLSYRLKPLSCGFTLLELLVVLVIIAITLGAVSFSALPDERQDLHNDAQRIALLLQLARDEAIVRNRAIAFEADPDRYRFLLNEDKAWQMLSQDDLFRERQFKRAPVTFMLDPPTAGRPAPLRIILGREPVDKPFVLTLSTSKAMVSIRADGVGHFSVE